MTDMRPTKRQQSPPKIIEADGLVLLEELAALHFTGSDVLGFLQGYLTSDAADLGPNPKFTALCNIKGRAICTGCAWLNDEGVILVVHRSLCAVVLDFLRPYLAFSRTNAQELPQPVVGCFGSNPPLQASRSPSGGWFHDDRHLFVLANSPAELSIDTTDAGLERWYDTLIERREVWLEAKTSGRFLPQMLGLVERGAVSFSKGCYLGQEVVARAQHRGQVKRELRELRWKGDAPNVGDAIKAHGSDRGMVVFSPPQMHSTGRVLAVLVRDKPGPFTSKRTNTTFWIPA